MKCETCKFFIAGDTATGKCVRYPPTKTVVSSDGNVWASFPVTIAELWCGEYIEKL